MTYPGDGLRVAIVGCGSIGSEANEVDRRAVRTHAAAWAQRDDVELVAVCDMDLERAAAAQAAWNVPSCFQSLDELLASTKLDILSICTPTPTHEAVLGRALDANLRAIWMEKPMGKSPTQTRALADRATRLGIPVCVNYLRRYSSL